MSINVGFIITFFFLFFLTVTPMDDTHIAEDTDNPQKKNGISIELGGELVGSQEEREPLAGRKVRLEVRDDGIARLSPRQSPRSSPRSSPQQSPRVSPRHAVDPAKADRFKNKQGKGNIDVYWLFDDGGKKIPGTIRTFF